MLSRDSNGSHEFRFLSIIIFLFVCSFGEKNLFKYMVCTERGLAGASQGR